MTSKNEQQLHWEAEKQHHLNEELRKQHNKETKHKAILKLLNSHNINRVTVKQALDDNNSVSKACKALSTEYFTMTRYLMNKYFIFECCTYTYQTRTRAEIDEIKASITRLVKDENIRNAVTIARELDINTALVYRHCNSQNLELIRSTTRSIDLNRLSYEIVRKTFRECNSVKCAAKQLVCSPTTLYNHYPELCKQYKSKRNKKISQEVVDKILRNRNLLIREICVLVGLQQSTVGNILRRNGIRKSMNLK